MTSAPTPERPVGGRVWSVLRVARPQKRSWRAFAALAPKIVLLARARTRRRRLALVPIAVTGSVGKTTTKNLVAAALASVGPTVASPGGGNRARGLVANVRRADASTRFLVQEIGASTPGSLDELLWALEPRVAVVTIAGSDHLVAGLGGAVGAAREKRKTVAVLPADGLAVLNADDPLVRAMADGFAGRVVLAGESSDADVRIVSTRLLDDARLEVTLEVGGRRHVAATRLVGRHWALAVALALATAVALGAEVEGALDAIGALEPSAERLELVDAPGGARLLLDTTKATEATMAPAFAALAALPARRRVAVIGSLWDFVGATEVEVVDRVTRDALAVADEVILYGPAARSAPAGLVDGRRVRAALSIHALSDDLHARFGHGDLVLLKGTFPYDHLVRIALVGTHDVRCWRDDCERRTRCGECRLLGPALK